MLFSNKSIFRKELDMVRLYVHEAARVYRDKMVEESDMKAYDKIVNDTCRKWFEEQPMEQIMADPLIFTNFAKGTGQQKKT